MDWVRKDLNNKSNSNVDYSMMNQPGMLDDTLPPAFPQGQGSYSNPNQMMVLKQGNNSAPIKDKDEALKMLYNMMMTRVSKKRQGNY